MAKRFTDTNKYKKPFIRGLQGAYKILWDYLYHDCDHAGIWIVDFEIAQLYIGNDMPVNKSDALKYFNTDEKRIIEIDNGHKWFIPSFIEFQYGELSEQNRAHNSVITILKKYNLNKKIKPLTSPLQGGKDKDKDKDMDMVKDMDILPEFFDIFSEWLKFKRGRKETYKDEKSLKLCYQKLLNFSNSDPLVAKMIIEKSMANNWSGFFELDKKDKPIKPDTLGPGEEYINGFRMCLTRIIPPGAPPRPSKLHKWSYDKNDWYYGN